MKIYSLIPLLSFSLLVHSIPVKNYQNEVAAYANNINPRKPEALEARGNDAQPNSNIKESSSTPGAPSKKPEIKATWAKTTFKGTQGAIDLWEIQLELTNCDPTIYGEADKQMGKSEGWKYQNEIRSALEKSQIKLLPEPEARFKWKWSVGADDSRIASFQTRRGSKEKSPSKVMLRLRQMQWEVSGLSEIVFKEEDPDDTNSGSASIGTNPSLLSAFSPGASTDTVRPNNLGARGITVSKDGETPGAPQKEPETKATYYESTYRQGEIINSIKGKNIVNEVDILVVQLELTNFDPAVYGTGEEEAVGGLVGTNGPASKAPQTEGHLLHIAIHNRLDSEGMLPEEPAKFGWSWKNGEGNTKIATFNTRKNPERVKKALTAVWKHGYIEKAGDPPVFTEVAAKKTGSEGPASTGLGV